ncbi:MAG: hypothetical protein PVJ98_03280 [Akkermansiaceae bacterium]|jgi:hypothetical protein
MKGKIVMIGLKSSAVDFEKWPDLTVEKLEAAFSAIEAELSGAGYDPLWCLIGPGEEDLEIIKRTLREETPDLVMVGAGVRLDPDQFLLFEKVVNVIHEEAPQAKIAFNTDPFDTVQAVDRWLD